MIHERCRRANLAPQGGVIHEQASVRMRHKSMAYCVFHRACAALTFFFADSAVNGGLMSAIDSVYGTEVCLRLR
jgi:hypothetical protein